jgi:transcriptional regulator with XRE-family HTH domain
MIRSDAQARALGAFIRAQRRLAELSQRELARAADLSDAYVSKLERGLHQPTIGVLRAIGVALNVRADEMLAYSGWLDGLERSAELGITEAVIRADPCLTAANREILIAAYRSLAEAPVRETAAAESPVVESSAPAVEDSIAPRAT